MQNHTLRLVSIFKRMWGGALCYGARRSPLRSSCQHGIRHTRGLLGETPVKDKRGGSWACREAFSWRQVELTPVKGEREGRTEESLKLQCNSEKISTGPRAGSKSSIWEVLGEPRIYLGGAGQDDYLCCAQSLPGAQPRGSVALGLAGAVAESSQSWGELCLQKVLLKEIG